MSVCSLSELLDSLPGDDSSQNLSDAPLIDIADTLTTDVQTAISLTQQDDSTWKASPEGKITSV